MGRSLQNALSIIGLGDKLTADVKGKNDLRSIQQAFGSGGTQQEQLQQLITQNPRAFLQNAPALKNFFELSATPVQPDLGAIINPLDGGTTKTRTGVDAFSRSPEGEAAFQQQQNVQPANLNQFIDPTGFGNVADPELKAELEAENARGGEALMREAEELEQTVEEQSTSTLGKEFDDAKKPLPSEAVKIVKDFARRQQAIIKKAKDNPNDANAQKVAALTLKKLQEIKGGELTAARKRITDVETFNDALTKSKAKFVADARLKSNEVDDFKFSADFMDGLLSRGIPDMKTFIDMDEDKRKKIINDIHRSNSTPGTILGSSNFTNVSVLDEEGNPVTSFVAYFTEETDPESLVKTVKMHRIDPEGFEGKRLVKSSVVTDKPENLGRGINKTTIEKGRMIDSALVSIGGMEKDFLTLRDQDLNSILNVSGGVVSMFNSLKGAMQGLENTFTTQASFTDKLFSNSVVKDIVDNLAPEHAAFFSSYSWTLFKLAIATQEGAGKALSDKDIERVKPQLKLGSAVAFKASIRQATKNLRRQRKLIDRQLNIENPALSVKDIDEATSVTIDSEGNVRSLGGTKLEKPKTKMEKFKELFK